MSEQLLEVSGLSRSFGGIAATSDVSLKIARGEIHAVIGPNGAGKTTLVALLAGELAADSGTIRFREGDITLDATPARARRGLARTFQVTSIFSEFSALENVALAAQAHTVTRLDSGNQRRKMPRFAKARWRPCKRLALGMHQNATLARCPTANIVYWKWLWHWRLIL